MPNQWNEVLDGVINAGSNIALSLLAKNHRQDAEKAFTDFKKKLISSYSSYAKAQQPKPEASQALVIPRSGNATTPGAIQPPPVADEAQEMPFEPLATYAHLMDFKTALKKNMFSKRYSTDADNLFGLLFGSDFIENNINKKKFTPDELHNMTFDAARAMNKRQIINSIMLLNEEARNKLIQTNAFANRMYQRKSGMRRIGPRQSTIMG